MSMEIPPGDWVQHESERLEQIWEQNFHPAVSKAVCCKMLRKTSGGCHQQCFCIQHTVKGPLFSTALDPCPAVPPRRASSQPQHAQCSTRSGLAPWPFALQPIALGGRKVQVLPWMCITNKRSRIHRGFLKLNQVYTLQRLTVLAVLKCWALARILLPSMSGQWDSLPTSAGH